MAADCLPNLALSGSRAGEGAGQAARVLAALWAAPRAIAPRAMTSLNATTSSKGDSPFEEAAHRGGAGTAKPADIDEARYSL